MSRKKTSQNNNANSPTKKNRRAQTAAGVTLPLRYRLLMLACGAMLVCGFFFAARQHFASIDFSMRNSHLRKMSDELEADKRRLLLAKEIALSPDELKKAAQKISFTTNKPASVQTAANDKTEKPRAEKSETATKIKQAVVEKADELAADAKQAVKKLTETKAPDLRARREPTQAER